ncbi:putative transcriptional regulatory protein C530.05-like protein 5 [Colletotrichum chlorophyti]|uniref:Putative transcriptional regulatory protein C530.05-like protein 5 n=1 Tax=Colletotrichum chlorophyti TaxID=708187 RepID=A0A1Q8RSD1_9PEZI|nr:putative transcriptional regulatory protein C530.05-like protein 5 [Colletotrichum chlorophyti]
MAGAAARTHKSCDACKSRKVRCPVAKQLLPSAYSPPTQRPTELPNAKAVLDLSTTDCDSKPEPTPELAPPRSPAHRIQELHVDRVLARAQDSRASTGKAVDEFIFVPVTDLFFHRCCANTLTFFSDSRLLSLSTRLRNNKVNELVGRIAVVINGRLGHGETTTNTTRKTRQLKSVINPRTAATYIKVYFDRVQPVFPFLDRVLFETTVASPEFPSLLDRSKPWSCLYHTILALGCQYAGGGTFEPGKGESWQYFAVSLGSLSDLLLLPDSLVTLQALTAMSVYSLCLCGLAVEPVILSEAARRAQMMCSNNFTGPTAQAYHKAFWTLYAIEKITCFHMGKNSSFVDSDICCSIPIVPEAAVGDFNWFLHLVRFGRLLSRAYTSLFSAGVSGNSNSYYLDVIDQLNQELEQWRSSLPDTGFRPGGLIRPQTVAGSLPRLLTLTIHYLYNSLSLTLSRATLAYLPASGSPTTQSQKATSISAILAASRSILELTSMIEVEPYTVIWIIAAIPISGLFVLFDIVIHEPRHQDTASNLALLDMAAGHFSRIEYASGGTVPGSLISEFAKIARDYVNELQQPKKELHRVVQPSATAPEVALPGALMGTDVMGIFNYFLPDLDPMFYQGPAQDYDILRGGGSIDPEKQQRDVTASCGPTSPEARVQYS